MRAAVIIDHFYFPIAQIRFIRGRSYSFVKLGEENWADLQPRDEQLTFHGSEFWPPPYPLHRLWQLSDSEMSVRGSHKIDLSPLCKSARDPNTGYRRRPDSRVPKRILKSKHLCTSGGLSLAATPFPTCTTTVYPSPSRVQPAFAETTWSTFRGRCWPIRPRSMRPFDFPYREPRYSACPPSPPSLFRFPGIRVIEFTAERMENMEEGFENVSRWGWNILPPFSSFLFVLYKRHVNFGLCTSCV